MYQRSIPFKRQFPPSSNQSLKTTIGDDAELCIPIWHDGTHEAILICVITALDTIKKRGTIKAFAEACALYVEHYKALKQAEAALAVLDAPTSKDEKTSKKASQKSK
jgi:hypothetical protein